MIYLLIALAALAVLALIHWRSGWPYKPPSL